MRSAHTDKSCGVLRSGGYTVEIHLTTGVGGGGGGGAAPVALTTRLRLEMATRWICAVFIIIV